jgi:nitrogenase molybdenum-cofactor synthesis protein NifE
MSDCISGDNMHTQHKHTWAAKRLSECKDSLDLEQATVALYPGFPCAFRAVSTFAPKINDSYALMIGPEICLYNTKMHDDVKRLINYPFVNRLLHLVLTQQDIILGFAGKIREAILDICTKLNPRILFVVTTCVCEIIGEDIDAIVEGSQKYVRTKLLLIHTDNFRTEDCAPGIENIMLVLEQVMVPQKLREKSVNFLGAMMSYPKEIELARLLQHHGVEILNVLPAGGDPDDIARAPEAMLNIVLSHYGLPLAEKMKERFGTPYVYAEKAYLPDSIAQDYLKIAEHLHIDLADDVATLKSQAEACIEAARNRFRGKSCAIGLLYGVQISRYFDLAHFFHIMGFEVKALFLNTILPSDTNDMKHLAEHHIDPMMVKVGDDTVIEAIVKDIHPDYFFGGFGNITFLVRSEIETRNLHECNRYYGFEVISRVIKAIDDEPPGLEALKYREMLLRARER